MSVETPAGDVGCFSGNLASVAVGERLDAEDALAVDAGQVGANRLRAGGDDEAVVADRLLDVVVPDGDLAGVDVDRGRAVAGGEHQHAPPERGLALDLDVRPMGVAATREHRLGRALDVHDARVQCRHQLQRGIERQGVEPRVRRAAARALGRIEDSAAIPTLAQLLARDTDPGVRRAAAWALGKIE